MPQNEPTCTIGGAAFSSAVYDTADAVGVTDNRHWYVAIVNHGMERICCNKLVENGFESYVPSQTMVRRYSNGRKKKVASLVLPAKVFVRATEQERLKQVATFPLVNRFLADRARKASPGAASPAAIIPDEEMRMFRIMLEQDDYPVGLESAQSIFSIGDRVRVSRGKLAGLEGTVRQAEDGKRFLYISLSILGAARVEIDRADVVLI